MNHAEARAIVADLATGARGFQGKRFGSLFFDHERPYVFHLSSEDVEALAIVALAPTSPSAKRNLAAGAETDAPGPAGDGCSTRPGGNAGYDRARPAGGSGSTPDPVAAPTSPDAKGHPR
jgi:hypothetical protein